MPRFRAELVPAMVTPFHADQTIDHEAAERLAKYLIDNGCDGLLVNGTTGESPTLSLDEKIALVKTVQKAVQGKNIPILAGVGSNDTKKSADEAKKIAALGVDALLVVVPYYNRPSQNGMIAHFSEIAKAVPNTEIIIYNIPGRCGVRMMADTMATLHQRCPNIIGVKQSFAEMDAVSEIALKLPTDTWTTWCGDDSLTVPMIACGAYGTISVAAHLVAPHLRDMIRAAKAGERQKALSLHLKLLHLNQEIFFLPNPTVVKTCLAKLGMMEMVFRSPIVPPDETEMKRIDALMAHYKTLMPQVV